MYVLLVLLFYYFIFFYYLLATFREIQSKVFFFLQIQFHDSCFFVFLMLQDYITVGECKQRSITQALESKEPKPEQLNSWPKCQRQPKRSTCATILLMIIVNMNSMTICFHILPKALANYRYSILHCIWIPVSLVA